MHPSRWAKVTPDKPAVIDSASGELLTFAELADRCTRFARLLDSMGLQPGDRLAVLMENNTRYFEIVWGALTAGLYVIPVSQYATVAEAAYVLTDSQAHALVSSAKLSAVASELPNAVHTCSIWLMVDGISPGYLRYEELLASSSNEEYPDDAPIGDYMAYSSGTTGRPKGIVRPLAGQTLADGPQLHRFLSKILRFDDSSVYLSTAPLYHGAPIGFTIAALSLGASVVFMPKFEALDALTSIERYRVTHSQWVPTMFIRMLRLPEAQRVGFDLSSHTVAVHSAAPCPQHVKHAMMKWWGPILHEYYSGSEGPGITYVGPEDWLAHPGTVGRPLGFKLHICDEEGRELPAGATGRVYFEQRRATFEYHNEPTKTAGSRHPVHQNWMSLDDLGHLDEDGFLYLSDRASFMIISGGVNIYPQEIEDCLLRHPAVGDVAVIGVPNEEMGEEIKAIVETVPGVAGTPALEQELIDFARTHLAAYKRPRSVDFDELPRLATGKLSKPRLRERYWANRESRIL